MYVLSGAFDANSTAVEKLLPVGKAVRYCSHPLLDTAVFMTATREAIIYSFISTRPPGSVRASHRQYVLLAASKSIPCPTTSAEPKEKVTKSKGKRSQAGGRPVDARDAVRPYLILVYFDPCTDHTQCESRDNDTCLITKTGSLVEMAHIFPSCLGQRLQSDLAMFWFTLQNFWSKDRVAAWKNAVTWSGQH